MPKPKIFISHSAHEGRPRAVLFALKAELERAGFEVLLDKTRLEGGDEWREELVSWMWQCHAAVILLSEPALASPWVKIEAANLISRRSLSTQFGNPRFLVLPVLFDPVTPARLPGTDFSPLALDEIQAVPSATDRMIVDAVMKKLQAISERFADLAPFGTLKEALAGVLSKHIAAPSRQSTLEKVAARLGVSLAEAGVEKELWLVSRVLQTDFVRLRGTVQVIGPFLGPDNAREFWEAVSPFCLIDHDAAERVHELLKKPEGQRAVGLKSLKPKTAERYVRRASTAYPPWALREFEGGNSAALVEEIIDSVKTSAKLFLGYLIDDEVETEELKQLLAEEFEADNPLVIVIPDPLPDSEAIRSVMEAFPQVIYVFLTNVEFLLPELDSAQEAAADREDRMAEELIKRIKFS
jgi:hypothetical protein